MYEGIITGLYGIYSLIKNKIFALIILIIGLVYVFLYNYVDINILKSIDFNAIMILIGTYGLSKMIIKTNILNHIINLIVERATTYKNLIIIICITTFIASNLINNNVLLPFIIPFVQEIIKRNNIKSNLLIESVIISSILGSMSTLIGSNNTIIISSYLNMNFLDFFFYDNRIGIYIICLIMFFIQIAIINITVKNEYFIGTIEEVEIKDKFNIYLFLTMIIMLLITSLIKVKYLSGIASITCLIIGIVKNKKIDVLFEIDYTSVIIYIIMFIYIGLLKNMSYLNGMIEIIKKINSPGIIYTLFFVTSILLSLIFNPIFIFYYMTLLAPQIVFNIDIETTLLIYATYFGLMAGLLKRKELKNTISYQTIICMLICSYIIIAFLFF